MFNFNFQIINTFSKRWEGLYNTGKKITKNKAWEFNLYSTNDIIRFEFNFTTNCDHSGLYIDFGLIGYAFDFSIYDIRHWDHENDVWEKYE